jgi:hypothetical protein
MSVEPKSAITSLGSNPIFQDFKVPQEFIDWIILKLFINLTLVTWTLMKH